MRVYAVPTVIIAALILLIGPLARAEQQLAGDMTLMLSDAIWREKPGDAGATESRELLLSIVARDGQMQPDVLGAGVAFSRSYHEGKVVKSSIDGRQLTLELDMDIHTDWQTKGGPGHYLLHLQRSGNTVEGTYEGTYRQRRVAGKVSGLIPQPEPMIAAAKAGEHPRLALRSNQVQALRAAAKTPRGEAIVARLRELLRNPSPEDAASQAAGHALLHLLEGQEREAQAARAAVKYTLDRGLAYRNYDEAGSAMIGVALAYDLCYDAWDVPFRLSVARALAHRSGTLLDFGDRAGTGFDQNPGGAWLALARGGAGVCGLAALEDPLGPAVRYDSPILRDCQPSRSFAPGRGVLAEPLVLERFPSTQWLYAGPFPWITDRPFVDSKPRDEFDHLRSIGGRDNAAPRIELGTVVTSCGVTRRFEKLPLECLPADQNGHIRLDCLEAANHQPNGVWYFFTVLHNDQVRYARIWEYYNDFPAVWVAGQRLHDNQPLKLGVGFIPILFEARIGAHENYLSTGLYFHGESEREATGYAKWLESERAKGAMMTEPRLAKDVRLAKLQVERFCTSASPDAQGMALGAYPFLLAYRNTMGIDIAPAAVRGYRVSQIVHPHQAIFALVELLEH